MCGYTAVSEDGSIFVCLFVCLFVCFLCVCAVTEFSAEDKASGVKFCTVVHPIGIQGRNLPFL